MTEELKRCPFCGGKVTIFNESGKAGVLCLKCSAKITKCSCGCEKKNCVNLWNCRVLPDLKALRNVIWHGTGASPDRVDDTADRILELLEKGND